MNQVVHIFRKDARHYWREIVVSLLLVAAYGWREASRPGLQASGVGVRGLLFSLLTPLVPLAWAFLIVRVVHGEPLVGDRQFWVTRPYEWRKLLAAKLIFMVVFVNVPLLILQAFLLMEAGFSPVSHFGGLLWMQLLWILFVFLPVGTLATVTSSVGQVVLAVIAILIYLIALAAIVPAVAPESRGPAGSFPTTFELVITLAVALTIIGWQYSRRKTARSRRLLLGLAAFVAVTLFAMPYGTLIRRSYPEGAQLPAKIAFDPAPLKSHQGGIPSRSKVEVRIPLLVSGVADGSVVGVSGIKVSIQGPGGERWNSGWCCAAPRLLPDRPHAEFDLPINTGFFERVKSRPVNLRIWFALNLSRASETTSLVARPNQFSVPGEGRCGFSPVSASGVVCVFPFAAPYLQWSAKSNEVTCTPLPGKSALPAGAIGYGWTYMQVPFEIEPVKIVDVGLPNWGVPHVPQSYQKICAGTPLTFRVLQPARRVRDRLDIRNLRLADYELKAVQGGVASYGLGLP